MLAALATKCSLDSKRCLAPLMERLILAVKHLHMTGGYVLKL